MRVTQGVTEAAVGRDSDCVGIELAVVWDGLDGGYGRYGRYMGGMPDISGMGGICGG